jgi:hypothetical protein
MNKRKMKKNKAKIAKKIDIYILKKKQKNTKTKESGARKGICMNAATPLKDQICESWAL